MLSVRYRLLHFIFIFPPALLRYNWKIKSYIFKEYNMMIWWTYALWNVYHCSYYFKCRPQGKEEEKISPPPPHRSDPEDKKLAFLLLNIPFWKEVHLNLKSTKVLGPQPESSSFQWGIQTRSSSRRRNCWQHVAICYLCSGKILFLPLKFADFISQVVLEWAFIYFYLPIHDHKVISQSFQ